MCLWKWSTQWWIKWGGKEKKHKIKQIDGKKCVIYATIYTRCSIWTSNCFILFSFLFRLFFDFVFDVVYQWADKVPLFFTFLRVCACVCVCALIRGASSMQSRFWATHYFIYISNKNKIERKKNLKWNA